MSGKVTKQSIVNHVAATYGWTKADVERAIKDAELTDTKQINHALLSFAGRELKERQRLQAAQKSQATKSRNTLQQKEQHFKAQFNQLSEDLAQAQSSTERWRLAIGAVLKADITQLGRLLRELRDLYNYYNPPNNQPPPPSPKKNPDDDDDPNNTSIAA